MIIFKARPEEMAPFYHTYLNLVADADVIAQLKERLAFVLNFWGSLPAEKHDFVYAPGKWTPRQVLGHLSDTERIMGYRALCIARKETQPLPGFDENAYVENADFQHQSFDNLIAQFEVVRKSSILLFENLTEKVLDNAGTASGQPVTVRGLASIISGHEMHHTRILQERYL